MHKKLVAQIIISMLVMILLGYVTWRHESNIASKDEVVEDTNTDKIREEKKDDQKYKIKYVDMSQKETNEAKDSVFTVLKQCKHLYHEIDKGQASNVTLTEKAVHQMINLVASKGYSVTCGAEDYNMQHYKKVNQSLIKARNHKDSDITFYVINSSGIFLYQHLQFQDQKLFVTSASASFDENMEMQLNYVEKLQVYQWNYTKKGWLIWEKALSRNQEMDMHVCYRVLPLDDQCREITQTCIAPIGYFCNNLFLENWDAKSVEKINFNDLFEFLYYIDKGKQLDENKYTEGIPKKDFEEMIQKYFDISKEKLQKYAHYDRDSETYPWIAIDACNRTPMFQPLPEVVKCEKNKDGTITAYVENVFMEEGEDCSFRHQVTLRKEQKNWVYVGNKIEKKYANDIPSYRARSEYQQ
ncbi:MAG: DUF6070 family protein [Lachnospiraceae bacterium]|nr:DUF6070 family protein [Lachnospiraceae bacterium]